MSDNPEPERTREIRPPQPDGPTHNIPTPPPDRPTREIRAPQPERPTRNIPTPAQHPSPSPPPPRYPTPPPPPPPRRPTPPPLPQAGAPAPQPPELPWWQTIKRDKPPPAVFSNPPPPHRVSPPPAPNPNPSKAAPRLPVRPTSRPVQPSPPPVAVPPNQSRRALLLGVGIAAAVGAAVAIGAVLAATKNPAVVLDVTDAQLGVELVLRDQVDGYGLSDIGPVLCNDGRNPAVEEGAGFECTVSVEGVQRRVNAVFQDDQATYAVDRPR
jgi:hypothetical protein